MSMSIGINIVDVYSMFTILNVMKGSCVEDLIFSSLQANGIFKIHGI